jgi:signal transduction histidine kinase
MGASMSSEQLATKIALLTRNLHKFVATVDRVTEVAQLRDGNLALEPTDVDLAEVVAIVVGQQQRLASAGGVEIVVRAPPTLRGRWDRGRLAQIVTNLITNAIRFGCGGEAEIEVIDRGSNAELVVRDHGPGLAPHELKGIFDRFDHRRSRAAGGFGVGLFIVKTLAEAMGGLAIAANASGGGARFSVVLPRGSTRG